MKEIISRRQAVVVIALIIFGDMIILGGSYGIGQDSWASQPLAAAISIPLLMICARLVYLYPGLNLFDIFIALFGKLWGSLLILLTSWYALHLGALVTIAFSEFIKVVSMPETPQLPVTIVFLLVVIYLVKSGIETIGKWALVVVSIVASVALTTTLIALNQMDFSNILPLFGNGPWKIAASACMGHFSSYGEAFIFLSAADAVDKRDSPYKIFAFSILMSTAIMTVVILRNIFVIGPILMESAYFPSYMAARIIKVGDYLQRIEGLVAINFILAGMGKAALCVLAAAKGAAAFFSLPNYRQIVLPVSLLAMSISIISFDNVMELFDFLNYYPYYAFPFQYLIIIGAWITAEFKTKKGGSSQTA